jgi:SAM-dependent methyltransferase
LAWLSADDECLPSTLADANVVLNRMRLATFLAEFADDKDVGDLLWLDAVGNAAGLPLTSTGLEQDTNALATRPFRIWEYAWLYKTLKLSEGGRKVLDLGGSASHLSLLAALAGCQVTTVDINPEFVRAARECSDALGLKTLDARIGDMRELSSLSAESFDLVVSCSVLEHLSAGDQEIAVREMARVLKPGGMIGLTFDFGLGAPGANEHLPPPHDPPPNAAEALRRYLQPGLILAGNRFEEDPIPGSLFRDASVRYTVASLFLGKAPLEEVQPPRSESGASIVSRVRVEGLPYRVLKSEFSRGQTATRTRQLERQCAVLQQAAEERLAAMLEKDREIARLSAELSARELRANVLEQAAEERLAAMREKDRKVARLRTKLAEVESRANVLIQAAEERLAAMLEKDREIAGLAAELSERQSRTGILQQAADERLAAMHEKDREIARLSAELANRVPAD